MRQRKLILVRHSKPHIAPGVPAREWNLSEEGRALCREIAKQIAPYMPDRIVTSTEIKAVQTGQLIADSLNVPFETADGLHEHDRQNEPFESASAFEGNMVRFFKEPQRRVYGRETADDAYGRFRQAVDDVLAKHDSQTMAVVAHGTVMTLLISRHNQGVDPFVFWKRLALPAFMVLSVPEFSLLTLVNGVAD